MHKIHVFCVFVVANKNQMFYIIMHRYKQRLLSGNIYSAMDFSTKTSTFLSVAVGNCGALV